MVNMKNLATSLQKCQSCGEGPLDLCNISEDIRSEGVCPVLKVRCSHCDEINIICPAECYRTGERGPPTFDINSRAALRAFHSGLGDSQHSGLLATLGLPSLTAQNYKHRERESGKAVEAVAK